MFLTSLFEEPLYYVTVVTVVVASITLHELGHALAATWEGDPTPKIRGHLTWNPIVHMGWKSIALLLIAGISYGLTPVTPAMFRHRRWGEVIVSAAGPLVNLALAVVAAVVLSGMGRFGVGTDAEVVSLAAQFWSIALYLNVSLFFLNMIPLPPLDGFTVAEGTVNLGDLGPMLRRAFPWTLIGAWFLFSSAPFQRAIASTTGGMLGAASSLWSVFR
ncbi:MAG: site-2 protease family protein [Planctomycetes bacterium]|nr:site-2 protease family protein [Planctomycetota bacterium]